MGCALAIIVGIGGLVAAGVGIGGLLHAVGNLSPGHSVFMLVIGGAGGSACLPIGGGVLWAINDIEKMEKEAETERLKDECRQVAQMKVKTANDTFEANSRKTLESFDQRFGNTGEPNQTGQPASPPSYEEAVKARQAKQQDTPPSAAEAMNANIEKMDNLVSTVLEKILETQDPYQQLQQPNPQPQSLSEIAKKLENKKYVYGQDESGKKGILFFHEDTLRFESKPARFKKCETFLKKQGYELLTQEVVSYTLPSYENKWKARDADIKAILKAGPKTSAALEKLKAKFEKAEQKASPPNYDSVINARFDAIKEANQKVMANIEQLKKLRAEAEQKAETAKLQAKFDALMADIEEHEDSLDKKENQMLEEATRDKVDRLMQTTSDAIQAAHQQALEAVKTSNISNEAAEKAASDRVTDLLEVATQTMENLIMGHTKN